jgi:CelD/BcsL family acetyltransferase involved in cellulose biosynthesis
VLEGPAAVGPIYDEWDRLAVDRGRPFGAPAWMLAWWSRLRPRGAAFRVVAVADDAGRLVGVVPLFAAGRRYAVLGDGVTSVEPLAAAGREATVAAAAVEALAGLVPRPSSIRLEVQDDSPDWPALLGRGWPATGGSRRLSIGAAVVPRIRLDTGFDAWLVARSKGFRRETLRKLRRLEEDGGSFRFATGETLEADVEVLLRLHGARQDGAVPGGMRDALVEAGHALVDAGRFRLVLLEVEGRSAAAQLLLTAGDRASGWIGGFDVAFGRYSPSIQCILHVLRDMDERGERTLVLGPGDQDYKRRFATEDGGLRSCVVFPPGRGQLVAGGRERADLVTRRLEARARHLAGDLRRRSGH